jgi:hypothetical protein
VTSRAASLAALLGLVLATPLLATGKVVEHLVARTVAEAGRTRMIAFRIGEPAATDTSFEATSSDPGRLEVLGEATVLAGETLGWLRVRGTSPGHATLRIAGAPLEVEVVPRRAPADNLAPTIVGPTSGAALTGRISVGVRIRAGSADVFLDCTSADRSDASSGSSGRVRLSPVNDTLDTYPPWRELLFQLDTCELPRGPLTLTPVAVTARGETRGKPVTVFVLDKAEPVAEAECEERLEVDRPQRFADDRASVGRHAGASGGGYFMNASAQPAYCLPLEIPETARYQVFLRASGHRAQGTLPSVGLVVDGAQDPRTGALLLDDGWHRLALGTPISLDEGTRVLTPFFLNDFYVPDRVDRNLLLDRIEVYRVPDGIDAAISAAVATEVPPDPFGLEPQAVRVAFVRPLHGGLFSGSLLVEGRCWWDSTPIVPPPDVTLLVNGHEVDTQRSGAPRFLLDAAWLLPGENTIELVARGGEALDRTPPQILEVREPRTSGDAPRHRRFSIHEQGWARSVKDHLVDSHYPKERRSLAYHSSGSFALTLPDDLEGTFDVFVEARGDEFEGRAQIEIALEAGGTTTTLGSREIPPWWDTPVVKEEVVLLPGPKTLHVGFPNDHYVEGKGDRNLFLQAVGFVERNPAPDTAPPSVRILHPREGETTWLADAVVFEAWDDRGTSGSQILVDGVRTGITDSLRHRPGRQLLPLLLRHLDPGPHEIAVVVTDAAGNRTVSEPVTIRVADHEPAAPTRFLRATRILDRLAFGPDENELARILVLGVEPWLDEALSRPLDEGDLAALGYSYVQFPGRGPFEVSRRALSWLIQTPNPVRARLVLFIQNHFSTWVRKTDGERKWREHVSFVRLGAAPFGDLLRTSAESPAMLHYLDQTQSFADRINENYAREILELHTLGVDGGYEQDDVTALARVLTGWTVAVESDGRSGGNGNERYTFRFDERLHDGKEERVLGLLLGVRAPGAREERVDLILEALAAHPSTARHLAGKIAAHYVGVPADPRLVDELAYIFLETHGDLGALLLHLALTDELVSAAPRLSHPLDFALRLLRTTHHDQPWELGAFLDRSGQGLFDRPTPDGYPEEDATWCDSNALLQRWQLASKWPWLLASLVPGGIRYSNDLPEDRWCDLVIDAVAVRLTGSVLGPRSHEAALEILHAAEGNRDERARSVATFIARLPEANLR